MTYRREIAFLSSLMLLSGMAVAQQIVSLPAIVEKVSGAASISAAQTPAKPVTENMRVQPGSKISADSASVQLSLDEDATVTIEKGVLSIDKLAKIASTDGRRFLITLSSGTLHVRMQPGDSTTLLFTVNTPNAYVHLQNADADISVDKKTTTLDVIRSSAKIQLISNSLKTVVFTNCRAVADDAAKTLSISPFKPAGSQVVKSAQNNTKVAILSIQSQTMQAKSLDPLSDFVADEIRKKGDSHVLFLDDVRELLRSEGHESLLNCFTDSCISKIGTLIGVDMVVIGKVGQIGSQYTFDLKAIDVQRDRTLSRANMSVENDLGNMFKEIPSAIDRMVPDFQALNQSNSADAADSDNGVTPKAKDEIVWINGGKFTMGSNMTEGDGDETPRHDVTLSGFYMDKYEATRASFEKMMGYNPSSFKGCPNCPIDNISWKEAADYCNKRGMRLPTEAEWEYACRAGTTTPYSTGTGISSDVANFNGNKPGGGAPIGLDREKPIPVGSFQPNKFGLFDMHGNVSEWVSDWYDPNYYGNSDPKDPKGPANGKLKSVRGGSWKNGGDALRSANRSGFNPDLKFDNLGVRCVKN